MILICKRCKHIGLGDFDNAAITWAAPLLVSSMLLVEYSTKYNSVPVMLSMVRIFEYATDMTITAMSYEDSCTTNVMEVGRWSRSIRMRGYK